MKTADDYRPRVCPDTFPATWIPKPWREAFLPAGGVVFFLVCAFGVCPWRHALGRTGRREHGLHFYSAKSPFGAESGLIGANYDDPLPNLPLSSLWTYLDPDLTWRRHKESFTAAGCPWGPCTRWNSHRDVGFRN